MPEYLERHYWWAYVRPWTVRVFDRPWLINLILYGNYARLRDVTLAALKGRLAGRTLKVSCCYGSLTPELARHTDRAGGQLDLIDVVPAQLENARRKLGGDTAVRIRRMDAAALDYPDASFDTVLLFFLLHEMPQPYRERTMAEALRVLKQGGTLAVTDFGVPKPWNLFFRFLWLPILGILEPFAVALWRQELADLLPAQMGAHRWHKESYYCGLFQTLVGTK